MAGTVSETFGFNGRGGGAAINKVTLAWTTDAGGSASFTTTKDVNGTILRVVTTPGAGEAAPTDNYDVVLTDADGVDVLAGQGADRDAAAAEHVVPGVPFTDGQTASLAPVAVASPLTLTVSGAGDAKQGSVVVYFR